MKHDRQMVEQYTVAHSGNKKVKCRKPMEERDRYLKCISPTGQL